MTLAAKLRRAPLRVVTGAYILNSGVEKFRADEATAQGVHGLASGAYPVARKLAPTTFAKSVAAGEIALGSALLLPVVPAGLVGLGITGFAASLLGMWWRTPGMHEPGSLKPTIQGTGIAKDVWMLGIGASLIVDAALTESPITGDQARAEAKANTRAAARSARRTAHRAAAITAAQAARQTKIATKQARKLRNHAGDLLPS